MATTLAFAQSGKLAHEFQQGVDAYRLGEYEQARRHLEKARDLDPTLPGPYRFLAAVSRAEKRWSDCVEEAAHALRVAPQSREVADTRKLHDTCRVAAGRPAFVGRYQEGGAISITAKADGEAVAAAVSIDGKASGSAPLLPRAIPAGPHRILLSRAGSQDVDVQVTVLPQIVTDVEVVFSSRPDPAALEPGWLELPAELVRAARRRGAVKLTIDGRPVALHARLALPVGTHKVVLVRGKQTWSRTLEVTSGKTQKVTPIFHDSAKPAGAAR